jgi:hypothetical protein
MLIIADVLTVITINTAAKIQGITSKITTLITPAISIVCQFRLKNKISCSPGNALAKQIYV